MIRTRFNLLALVEGEEVIVACNDLREVREAYLKHATADKIKILVLAEKGDDFVEITTRKHQLDLLSIDSSILEEAKTTSIVHKFMEAILPIVRAYGIQFGSTNSFKLKLNPSMSEKLDYKITPPSLGSSRNRELFGVDIVKAEDMRKADRDEMEYEEEDEEWEETDELDEEDEDDEEEEEEEVKPKKKLGRRWRKTQTMPKLKKAV